MKRFDLRIFVSGLFIIVGLSASVAYADSGWYVGASVGQSYFEFDDLDIDDNGNAWKVYGGYVADLPFIDLGVEGGYVDFGNASGQVEQFFFLSNHVDVSGLNLWGVAGVDVGPIGLFGKLGAIAWDLDGETRGPFFGELSDDGLDVGFGIGAKFMLFSAEIRAEYEYYEIEDGIGMISVGANWVF